VSDLLQTDFFSVQDEGEMMSLRDLSARVGSDPLLVQASNGNTSIKLDGVMWIKASGKWLARATEEDTFVPIELAEVKDSIRSEVEVSLRHPIKDTNSPSIETPMHAVLRHRVVIHVHSINAIAWAIRIDGPDRLQERLAGLNWRWIPYTASGIPLARRIEKAVADAPETDVLILGNHGLVVCGSDCRTAEKLLAEVERRIAIPPRRPPEPDAAVLETIARISGWQFPEVETLHALGTDSVTQKILGGGVLYPCQAIFLGRTMPLFPPAMLFSKFVDSFCGAEKAPPFIAVEKSGVMLNEKMSDAERATLIALAEVAQRTPESTQLRYLEDSEVEDVLGGGADSYKEMVDVPAVER
jgi:rhamnose utilization protein RhaD (predicted bifunctional aldolase and dehydrogenase)